jgi:hypothetical protein
LNLRDQSALRMSACESSAHSAFNFQHLCGGTCSRLEGLWLIRERNYNEAGDRLDEARVVVFEHCRRG